MGAQHRPSLVYPKIGDELTQLIMIAPLQLILNDHGSDRLDLGVSRLVTTTLLLGRA